ncbi:MAG: phage tail tape measure protein [Clostridia bacterium]|nr:phage tail tape measure protein [Clostridia bacterium]
MAQITLKILMDDSGVKKESENLKKVLSEAFQPITKINTSGIENLRKSYANLLNTIKTNADKFPADTFQNVREQTEQALSAIIAMTEKLHQGGELSKEETEAYAELSNQIKALAADFATLRAQTERLEKVESERVPRINTLQKNYAKLRTTLKSYSEQYGEEKFDGFSKEVQNALDSVTALKNVVGDTEPDEEQKRLLIELGHQFENLSSTIETVRANSDKLQKAPKEYIPDIDKLQSKYAQLLKRVKDLSSQYPSGLFADAAEDIKDALENIMNMPSVLSDNDKGELRFLEDYYDTLKAAVNTIVATSEKLEKVDILNVSNQYSGLIEKINSLKDKYPEGTFDDITESANAAFNEIRSLDFAIGDGNPTDDQTKRIAELDRQYRRLNNELNTAKVRTEKLQKEQKISAPSVDTLRTNIANLAASLKNLSSSYPSGTFTEISAKASALLKRIQSLHTEIGNQAPTDEQKKALNALQKEYQSLSSDIATVKATTDRYTDSIETNGQTLLTWQKSATLVETGIRLLRNAFDDLNETLVSTEDKVIAIARVLPETGKTNAELADRLYDIGAEYSRNFEDVSEIAQNFAQGGYDFAETIQATEAAVLALNVAELTAEQSSEGLISVLAQFERPVNELINVIDILNMTADKMPVTTEELLAGLQKTGSYAKAAKMDLKETTAILASLSKATAASGQQIGNAMKSLIAYTTKTEALDLFAGMSEDLNQIVKEYRLGSVSILKVWQTLSEEMQSLTTEHLDLLEKYTNESGMENEIGAELTDIYEDLTGVYDTAGVYRKNYFIALMQELENVDNILADIEESAGYSAKENEAYLESYTGKITTLQSKWQAMLNDEQGFLGFKKDLADIGIEILDFTDKIGGLHTVLLLSGTAANAIWGKKGIEKFLLFSSKLGETENPFKKFLLSIQNLKKVNEENLLAQELSKKAQDALNAAKATGAATDELEAAAKQANTAATNANTAAQKANASAVSAVITVLLLSASAISMVANAIKQKREEEKLANEQTIESYKSNEEEARTLESLYDKYKKLTSETSSTEEANKELEKVEGQLVDILNQKSNILHTLTKDTDEYRKAIDDLTEVELKNYRRKEREAANAAETELLKNTFSDNILLSKTKDEKVVSALEKAGFGTISSASGDYFKFSGFSENKTIAQELYEYQILGSALEELEAEADRIYNETKNILDKEEFEKSEGFRKVSDALAAREESVSNYLKIRVNKYITDYKRGGGSFSTYDDAEYVNEQLLSSLGLVEMGEFYEPIINSYVQERLGIENPDGIKDPNTPYDPFSSEETRKNTISAMEKERNLQKESEEYAKHLQAIEEARTVSAEKRAEIAEKTKKIEEAQLKIAEAETNLAEKKKKLEEAETTFKVRAYDHKTGLFKWDISLKDVQAAKREKDDAEIDLHNAKVDLQDAILEQQEAVKAFQNYLRENDEAIREAEQDLQTYLKEEAFDKVIEKLGEESATIADILEILQIYIGLGHGSDFADDLISILEEQTGLAIRSKLVAEPEQKSNQNSQNNANAPREQLPKKTGKYVAIPVFFEEVTETDIKNSADMETEQNSDNPIRKGLEENFKKAALLEVGYELSKREPDGDAIREIFQSYLNMGMDTSFLCEVADELQKTMGKDARTFFDLRDLHLYDNGGVLHGIGGIKATKEDEGVIPPPLMKKILKPDRVAEFEKFLQQVNHALELAHISGNPLEYSPNPLKHAEFRNIANYDRHDRQYIVNGVPISSSVAETHTLKQIFETMALMQ